jgi:hypothetical protein
MLKPPRNNPSPSPSSRSSTASPPPPWAFSPPSPNQRPFRFVSAARRRLPPRNRMSTSGPGQGKRYPGLSVFADSSSGSSSSHSRKASRKVSPRMTTGGPAPPHQVLGQRVFETSSSSSSTSSRSSSETSHYPIRQCPKDIPDMVRVFAESQVVWSDVSS